MIISADGLRDLGAGGCGGEGQSGTQGRWDSARLGRAASSTKVPPLGAPRMVRVTPHLATGGGISGPSPQMLLAASLFLQQPYLASAGAQPVTYVKGNLAPLHSPHPDPAPRTSHGPYFYTRLIKTFAKDPRPLRARPHYEQLVSLSKHFTCTISS